MFIQHQLKKKTNAKTETETCDGNPVEGRCGRSTGGLKLQVSGWGTPRRQRGPQTKLLQGSRHTVSCTYGRKQELGPQHERDKEG